jgi:hypothetical protein
MGLVFEDQSDSLAGCVLLCGSQGVEDQGIELVQNMRQ